LAGHDGVRKSRGSNAS